MSAEVISLGCRLNLAESEQLRGLLAGAGELTVINSCAVTSEAVRQTRQAIRRARRARPDARLLVTGCAAEIERDMLAAMPEVDGLVRNQAKLDPLSYRSSPLAGEDTQAWLRSSLAHPPLQAALAPLGQASLSSPARGEERGSHTRAFVQVQNGCDHDCTFCVIPKGRGPSRSRSVGEVLAEVAGHCASGIREVVLTGVDLTSWGQDLPGSPRLGALVSAILAATPIGRLRLSSLDGVEIDAELFELIAGEARVMPHLHLSLQHGDDLMLKRMKRRHTRRDAADLVAALRTRRPELALGADLIAGFPTEDEAAHAANLAIVRELGVVHGHVFPYSRRPGTPAARMPQVDGATTKQRAAELREEVAQVRREWLQAQLGRPLDVLAERDGTGHAPNFARVQLPEGIQAGQMAIITPTRIVAGVLA